MKQFNFIFTKFHPEGEPETFICCVTKDSK